MGVTSTFGQSVKLTITDGQYAGTILDMYADETVKVSNNIVELFDVGEVPSTFTRQIVLPGTRKNVDFFEHTYDISVYNPDIFSTNQKVQCYLDFDGTYVISGFLQLDKVSIIKGNAVDSFTVTLFGVISNFSTDAKLHYLTELSGLQRFNHTASFFNISESWNRRLFNGDIVYPLAEYGRKIKYNIPTYQPVIELQENTTILGAPVAVGSAINTQNYAITIQHWKPAIKAKLVWDEVFDYLGYNYTGAFFADPNCPLNDAYLICNNAGKSPIFTDNLDTFGQFKTSTFGNETGIADVALTDNVYASIPANALDYDYDNTVDLSSNVLKYTLPVTSSLECEINLSYDVTSSGAPGSGVPQWYVQFVRDSDSVPVSTIELTDLNVYLDAKKNSTTTTATERQSYKVNFVTSIIAPTKYKVYLKYQSRGTANFSIKLNPAGANSTTFSVLDVRQGADQRVIDIPSNMPNGTDGITLLDFVKGIQKKYNLIIYQDKRYPDSVIVDTFNQWYKDGNVHSFNRYIDIGENIEVIPANYLAPKKLTFTDKVDSDYISTLFKRTNNRNFGQSSFYDSASFFSGGDKTVEGVFASSPLVKVQNSVYTGSYATSTSKCILYRIINTGQSGEQSFTYDRCEDGQDFDVFIPEGDYIDVCSRVPPYNLSDPFYLRISNRGYCSSTTTETATSGYPMVIPTFISDDKYSPAIVNPRLLYYNGVLNVQKYYFQHLTDTFGTYATDELTVYPYFDHYSKSGSSVIPGDVSNSLLYNNEQPVLGSIPDNNLISKYWTKYLELLYNPRTRVLKANAVIPIADYIDIELNDIAEFRGNYFHIRAINDYNLKTGECVVELLGPIIEDTISEILNRGKVIPIPGTTTTTTSTTTSTTTIPSTTTTTTSTTTSTTTAGCTQFMLTLVAADCPTACADISYDFAVESPSAVLALNSYLYIPGECGVTPIAAGYYADGNHCYQVDASGKVIGRSSCV